MGKYVWQVCATMEKLLDYVAKNYSSFFYP